MVITPLVYSQNEYINEDGTVSNYAKRQLMLEVFNNHSSDETRYDIENNYLIVITKSDCGDEKYEQIEMQKKAMYSSFLQLLNQISGLKVGGYDMFTEIEFDGIIFKTNTVCMYSTRRYHFKFNFNELIKLPEYMDLQELIEYVVIENKNKNIIYVKNQ